MKTYFSRTQKSSIVGDWTAPGAPEISPKGWARSTPPFGVVSGPPGPSRPPKIYDFWVPENSVFMIILMRSWGLDRWPGPGGGLDRIWCAPCCWARTVPPGTRACSITIVARSATILAIVGAIVGAIVSRLHTIATFAAAPLVPAPLPRLKSNPNFVYI